MADNQSSLSDTNAAQDQPTSDLSERSRSESGEAASLWTKFTAEQLMEDCPYTVAFKFINTSLWDVPATEDADIIHATTWVAKTVHDYHVGMAWDETLYFDYQWDFEGWTRELFQKVERNTLRSLKTVLRHRGVYTGNIRARVADSLFKLLGGENPPEWDHAEFQATDFDTRSKAYKRQQDPQHAVPAAERQLPQDVLPSHTQEPQPQPQPQPQWHSQGLQQGDQQGDRQGNRQGNQHGVRQGVRSHSQFEELQQPVYMSRETRGHQPRQQWEQSRQSQQETQLPVTAYREVTPFPQQPINRAPDRPPDLYYDPYKTLPPRWSRNDRLGANTITQFSKLWDHSNKYTGNAYDLLDDKIKIFFSICWQVDIQEEQFHAVFPRILTGRAETFYIQVVERDDSFAKAYTAIKNHFDHDVHHQHYYTDWTTTSFSRTRAENPEKGLHEVLQILLDKLQLCQRALGKNFEGEDALRTTVINACRGVLELEMALFKPANICEGLFSDLRSAVETHLVRQHSTQLVTD
jgi:hypothetical protein